MSASVASSRLEADVLAPDLIAQRRADLTQDLAVQQQQVTELRATAEALMGQHDSDSLLERELAEATAKKRLAVIAEIEDALIRIADGRYGACEACGAPIALARLEAIPHTPHCIDCPPSPARRSD